MVENFILAKRIETGITDHIIEYLTIFPSLNDAYDSQVFLDSRHLATETFHEWFNSVKWFISLYMTNSSVYLYINKLYYSIEGYVEWKKVLLSITYNQQLLKLNYTVNWYHFNQAVLFRFGMRAYFCSLMTSFNQQLFSSDISTECSKSSW